MFSFLEAHNICQHHALFHIARASCLELKGSHARADEAFERGIALRAEPLDRLRGKHQEFQHRMARRIQRDSQEGGASRWSAAAEPPGRKFGTTLASLGDRRPATGRAALGLRGPPQASQSSGPGSVLNVLEDGLENGGPRLPVAAGQRTGGWARFAPAATAVKENTQRAMPWKDQRLATATDASGPSIPVLEIFADEDLSAIEDRHSCEVWRGWVMSRFGLCSAENPCWHLYFAEQQSQPGPRAVLERPKPLAASAKGPESAAPGSNDPLRLHKVRSLCLVHFHLIFVSDFWRTRSVPMPAHFN